MKRFYRNVSVGEAAGGWQVLLDGRGVKTPQGTPQIVAPRALAEGLAREWADQGETLDPAALVWRDLADLAIDTIAPDPAATIADLLRYAETDTLCYRADPDEPLHARQRALWEPLLAAAEARYDVGFVRVSGVIHRPQPAETLARLRTVLAAQTPLALAALQTLSSLSASLVVGLAALHGERDPAALWAAAELEEDWQAQQWGRDAEAEARRVRRAATFASACDFAALVRGSA